MWCVFRIKGVLINENNFALNGNVDEKGTHLKLFIMTPPDKACYTFISFSNNNRIK